MATPARSPLIVIALTGDTKENDLKLAKNAGCDALLLKPCLPEILFAHVQRLLNLASV
jgi:CheY-like chemotaxis protein